MLKEFFQPQKGIIRFHFHEAPKLVGFTGTESKMVATREWGWGGEWEVIVQWVEFQVGEMRKFGRWVVVRVAQQCEWISCHWVLHGKTVNMVNFICTLT